MKLQVVYPHVYFPLIPGCGKTTLVQRLASLTGRQLLVLNLSLQTDSTDLLGGYKPLEIRHVARGVYDNFVDLFVSSFSRSQNAQFLRFVLNAFEKGDWKKLAQCFIKAAGMGEKKVRKWTVSLAQIGCLN
jgi:midasin